MTKTFGTLALALPLLVLLTGCGTTATSDATAASVTPVSSQVATPAPTATAKATTAPKPTATKAPTSSSPAALTVGSKVPTTQLLNALTVAPEVHADTYNRDLFKHWVSKNSTGCDTRFAVLKQESTTPITGSGCSIVSGRWVSEYDAGAKAVFTTPGKLDIDHRVPLAEAWRSGASNWSSATREAYANDLSNPVALVAVSASSNRSKGDQDPNLWMPATDGCTYVSRWVSVKYEWKLTVDAAEKADIVKVLSFCKLNFPATVYKAPVTIAKGSAPVASTPAAPVAPAPVSSSPAKPATGNDPQYSTCSAATAAGYGPYTKGQDPEYAWYRDGDGDGTVCE